MSADQYKILVEVHKELAMRRKVWKRVPGSQEQFVDSDQQRRYDILIALSGILEEMTAREFLEITSRIERHKADKKAQTSLF